MNSKKIYKYVNEILNDDINNLNYFYVNKRPKFSLSTLINPYSQIFESSHLLIFINGEKFIISAMDALGNFSDNYFEIYLEDVEKINVKRSFLSTKIQIEFYDENNNSNILDLKALNICIGLDKHKSTLIELNNLYN